MDDSNDQACSTNFFFINKFVRLLIFEIFKYTQKLTNQDRIYIVIIRHHTWLTNKILK